MNFAATAAQLVGCSADDIAIVPSASYGIATAARNLPVKKGQSILVLEEQFPSNYYSWQRRAEETGASLKVVPWPEDNDWTAAVLGALTSEVAIAALPHVQWTSGGRLDLVRIGQACRKIGSALVLDLTQSLGALPFSVGSLGEIWRMASSPTLPSLPATNGCSAPIRWGFSMSPPNGRVENHWKRIGFSAPTRGISRA